MRGTPHRRIEVRVRSVVENVGRDRASGSQHRRAIVVLVLQPIALAIGNKGERTHKTWKSEHSPRPPGIVHPVLLTVSLGDGPRACLHRAGGFGSVEGARK